MKAILMWGGIIIVVLAVLNFMNISINFPTSNSTTNGLIGGGAIVASRFV